MPFLSYKDYHNLSMQAKDVDTSIIALKYISDRFELNLEQRYWIAFLYGTCYCAATVYFIYNEFPDFESVDVKRLSKWWNNNKDKLIFQTDRARIKSNDQFVPSFLSYRKLIQTTQQKYFKGDWKTIYKKISEIKFFGRFSLFNYLDTLNQLTDVVAKPPYLNMLEAESCRNGLCYALGKTDWVDKPLNKEKAIFLHNSFLNLLKTEQGNIFQLETTLCAYKKYRRGKRYVGYYIDRMYKEIVKMEGINGVCWQVLWDFRKEVLDRKYLKEYV